MELMPDYLNKGYEQVLTLPSYIVLKHPSTFDIVVFYNNRMSKKNPHEIVVKFQDFGLLSDAPVTLPVGMWREWVKESKKMNGLSAPYGNHRGGPPDEYVATARRILQQNAALNRLANTLTGTPMNIYDAPPPAYDAPPPPPQFQVTEVIATQGYNEGTGGTIYAPARTYPTGRVTTVDPEWFAGPEEPINERR